VRNGIRPTGKPKGKPPTGGGTGRKTRKTQPKKQALKPPKLNTFWCVPNVLEQTSATDHASSMLRSLGFDLTHEHMKDTPRRLVKALVEMSSGLWDEPPVLTDFTNEHYDDVIVVGPITFESLCAHHLMPFIGEAYVGVFPGAKGRLPGLSKYPRVVDYFARRPQIQETMTAEIANFLIEKTGCEGVAVKLKAIHMCACARGIRKRGMEMATTTLRGRFFEPEMRAEFLAQIAEKQK